ncbi:hypothetical protein L6164_032870 [Bauhinia variegata]|uniref:Uncharacterized protein n=1 Tax=Bauhinia variegata TaxID=167791 RepID=A0ACB9KQ97_BAUVA|nr:hypothetical protein L6164_032870 [Bauhinia variegata]
MAARSPQRTGAYLESAAQRSFLHSPFAVDLKPDFGSAKTLEEKRNFYADYWSGRLRGTPLYTSPESVADFEDEYGVSPFSPMKGMFIQGPIFISFFLAETNMSEKMPSFKTGGASWFLVLTTPDPFYILPFLTPNNGGGLEGNLVACTMKNSSRGLAVLTVPFTAFPKAIFCYWITSNLFSLVYGTVLKVAGVMKTLGIPEIPVSEYIGYS